MMGLIDLNYDCLHALLLQCNLPTAVAVVRALYPLQEQTASALLKSRCTFLNNNAPASLLFLGVERRQQDVADNITLLGR